MSVKGFIHEGGKIEKYDYNSLDNLPMVWEYKYSYVVNFNALDNLVSNIDLNTNFNGKLFHLMFSPSFQQEFNDLGLSNKKILGIPGDIALNEDDGSSYYESLLLIDTETGVMYTYCYKPFEDSVLLKVDNTNIPDEVIASAIDAYLSENPIEGGIEVTPFHVITESQRVADNVLSTRNADSFVFAGLSDMHTDGVANDEDYTFPAIRNIGRALSIINNNTQIDLVANFGDVVAEHFTDKYKQAFKYVRECLSDIHKSAPYIQMQGNHDELSTDTTEEAEQKYWAYIGANNVGVVIDYDNKFRNYGYKDFDNYKIRVIYLNTVDVSAEEITGNWYISNEQMNWLINTALDLSDKTDSERWGVILFSHHHLTTDTSNGAHNLLTVINAFKGKESGNITHNSGETFAFDFSTTTSEFISHFHGHLHNFRAETLGTNEVLTITIPNACYGRNNEYGTSAGYNETVHELCGDKDADGNQRRFLKTPNSTAETAFNMVSVDRKNKIIRCYNYGAGIDRIWSYEKGVELATFNISTVLTNCTADENNVTSIYGTDVVTLNFIAEANYILPTEISVVGAKFEWDSSTGILTLSKPTRNIVITITTESTGESTGYTDIINVENEDYFQGYRVSTGSGTLKPAETDNNYVSTKVIDLSDYEKPVIIRTGGIPCNANLYGSTAYACFDKDGNILFGGYIKDGNKDENYGVSITVDEENNATIIIGVGIEHEVMSIRLSGYGNGADFIVTINEEIK